MEEVWKDINDHEFSAANFRHIILQDFLSSSSNNNADSSSAAAAVTPPPPPPPTLLTLNSARDFHFPDNAVAAAAAVHFRIPNVTSSSSSSASTFHGFYDQVLGPLPFEKKSVPDVDCNNPGDRRQKRMIKNRESAARSRARKQAHTLELEHEVKFLAKENALLKRQQKELEAAVAAQIPRKYRLQRTSTAPF